MSEPNRIVVNDVEYVRKGASYQRTKHGPWETGNRYCVRTVTMIVHGMLIDVTDHELVFTEASWIADTGRFHDFITGKSDPSEVEPFPQDKIVIVGRGSLIDACILDKVFNKQK